jgi:FMN phosphatase YigB (HAD superfamily)
MPACHGAGPYLSGLKAFGHGLWRFDYSRMNHAEAEQLLKLSNQPLPVSLSASSGCLDELHELLLKAKVVSFDIFDTLLVRTVSNATDVFVIVERESGVAGFHEARIRAEAEARERLSGKIGAHEVTLTEIYDALRLPRDLPADWPAERLMELELATEQRVLTRSPGVEAIYEMAVNAGKPVIAVSDMYLPPDFVQKMLAANHLPMDRVFVSCAYRKSKHEGSLYGEVAAALNVRPDEILHFGDNFKADCAAALQAGVAGYHLPALRDHLRRDTRFNQRAIKQLEAAATRGKGAQHNLLASALLAHLSMFKAANPAPSMASQFGAMYAGPLVVGFAYWLSDVAKAGKVKHLRLATRDGYITEAIWQRLGLPGRASIFHTSRRLTLMPALVTSFEKELPSLLTASTKVTLADCIQRLNLADDGALLEALGKIAPVDQPIDGPRRVEAALRALRECEALIQGIAAKELDGYQAYLRQEGFEAASDAVADCGWALSSQRRMERFVGEKFRGYYIGSLEHAYMHDGIKSFLFHKGADKGWVNIAERAVELLELPFASLEAQICRFDLRADGTVKPVSIDHEPQYEMVREVFVKRMHRQTEAFADFIRPQLARITFDEFREVLFILFDSLVNRPTAFEYHDLAGLPHNREYGKSDFATIGTFWRVPGNGGAYVSQAGITRWRDYIRIGWISMRQAGVGVTWARVRRVLRRRIFP